MRRLGPSRRSSFGRTFARAPRGARAARRARLRPIPSVRLNASTTKKRPARARTVACAREGDVEKNGGDASDELHRTRRRVLARRRRGGSSGVSRARGRRAAKKRSGAQRFAGKYRRRAFRRRATPRASTTRRDGERPTRGTRDIVTLASRAGAFVGGIGRRTGANLATEGGQLAGAAAQKRRPADGIRAGDARGGGGLLSRARGGVADARTRENGRRQGCHVRNARRVDGRARWMCCQSSGEKRVDLNKVNTRCLKIGGKITLNYFMTGYPYEKFSHPTTACFVIRGARPTVPSCLMSAPSAERRWSRRST